MDAGGPLQGQESIFHHGAIISPALRTIRFKWENSVYMGTLIKMFLKMCMTVSDTLKRLALHALWCMSL